MKRLLDNLIMFGLFLTFIFILFLSYWTLYPYKTLELTNIKLDKNTVNRGEHITISYDYCKYTDKGAEVYIKFIDGLENNVPMYLSDKPKGCGSENLSIYVPRALITGEFKIEARIRHKVNPIRTIEVTSYTDSFNVIK